MKTYIVEKQNKTQQPKPKQSRNLKTLADRQEILSCSQPTAHMLRSIVSWSKKRYGTDGTLAVGFVKSIFCYERVLLSMVLIYSTQF